MKIVAILAIMELGDLPILQHLLCSMLQVAILAIMELGDLRLQRSYSTSASLRRNPRYNGIGWFTYSNNYTPYSIHRRNPRYNGIGWFTLGLLIFYYRDVSVAILAIMELGDLPILHFWIDLAAIESQSSL